MTPLLLAVAGLALGPAAKPPSFLTEVVPVLTRQGCNQGACHGKGAGQNGFKLSLRGYAPDQDFASLTAEFVGRRVDPVHPANSLLLTKATGRVPHDGGKLFGPESREYRTLRAWLAAGAPGPDDNQAKLVRLDLTPGGQAAAPGDRVPLTAWATFADGRRVDVTWLTRFDTNDAAVVAVTPGGVATAVRPGGTAVRAAFLTEVAVAPFTVPFPAAIDPARFAGPPHPVDDAVFGQLKALRIEPAAVCTDAAFVRRATLDTIGRLPTPAEAAAFAADPSPDKRARLIDALLARPEFADYWALFLGDLFQNRKERDHDVRGVKGVRQFHAWLRAQVAAGQPWDEVARAVLTATGPADKNPAVGYYVVTVGEQQEAEKSDAGEAVAQALLGTRIGCAKCHNHPLEKYTQDDFYHFAAFFSRVNLDRKEWKDGVTTLKVGRRNPDEDGRPVTAHQPRTNAQLTPQPLDRSTPAVPPGTDPRVPLAAWVTDPRNEAFAGAMANRVWRHFLGVGLVEPVDDLRATNPPSNPVLWATLTREFVAHKFDLKHLMRLILTSRTYQLSSSTTPGNAADAKFYSHYTARRLPAEVLLDAVADLTGVPDAFDGYPAGTRAVQVPDVAVGSPFMKLFGRPERTTACACERKEDVSLAQLLHLQNSEALANRCRAGDGWLARELAATPDDAALVDKVTLRAFGRPATAAERDAVRALVAEGSPRADVFADLLWAVVNSKDFAFNH